MAAVPSLVPLQDPEDRLVILCVLEHHMHFASRACCLVVALGGEPKREAPGRPALRVEHRLLLRVAKDARMVIAAPRWEGEGVRKLTPIAFDVDHGATRLEVHPCEGLSHCVCRLPWQQVVPP
eukprot:383102-Alexandrium_andersonii.AAC.1